MCWGFFLLQIGFCVCVPEQVKISPFPVSSVVSGKEMAGNNIKDTSGLQSKIGIIVRREQLVIFSRNPFCYKKKRETTLDKLDFLPFCIFFKCRLQYHTLSYVSSLSQFKRSLMIKQ